MTFCLMTFEARPGTEYSRSPRTERRDTRFCHFLFSWPDDTHSPTKWKSMREYRTSNVFFGLTSAPACSAFWRSPSAVARIQCKIQWSFTRQTVDGPVSRRRTLVRLLRINPEADEAIVRPLDAVFQNMIQKFVHDRSIECAVRVQPGPY